MKTCFQTLTWNYFASTKRRQRAHREKVTGLPRPNGAPRQCGQRGEGCGLQERSLPAQAEFILFFLWGLPRLPFCSLWLPSCLSLVDQWCLQWTCFLILHLVKCFFFFLYFCWRLNICINCKYIWFITVKALVPISGFPPSSLLFLIIGVGSISKVQKFVEEVLKCTSHFINIFGHRLLVL